MRIDLHSLGTYNRLVRKGARRSASSLSQLSGLDTYVGVTRVSLVSVDDFRDELRDGEYAGVRVDFEGGLTGRTVLAFTRDEETTLANSQLARLVEESASTYESFVKEVGTIVTSGFVDGWADYLGTTIDITTPTYVEGQGADLLPTDLPVLTDSEHLLAFESRLETVDETVTFRMCLLPERGSLAELLEPVDGDDGELSLDKLAAFNRISAKGAEGASQHMTSMTGIETDVTVNRLSFASIEDAPEHVGDEQRVGTVLELDGTPGGYIAILFDEASGRSVVDALVPTEPEPGFEGMSRSAIEEISNVMTSGFIDGWANVLEATIDQSPPRFVHDMGAAIVDSIAARLGQRQEHAFIIDTVIRTADDEFGCDIYVLPRADELTAALEALDADSLPTTEAASFARLKNGET